MIYGIKRFSYREERITITSNEFPILRNLENSGWPKVWCQWIKTINPIIEKILHTPGNRYTPLFAYPRFSEWEYMEDPSFQGLLESTGENYYLLFSDNTYDPELGAGTALYGDRNGYLYTKEGNFFPKYNYIGLSLKDWYLDNFSEILSGGELPVDELLEDPKILQLYKAIERS